jgi:hypothetical protein
MMHHGILAGIAALVAVLFAGAPIRAGNPELLDEMRKEIRELKEDMANLRRSVLRDNELANREMKLLHERMARIEDSMARLAAPPPGASTRSASSFTPAAPMPTGTIRLYNTMPTEATLYVDGVGYAVPPFSVRTLPNHPVGAITYQASSIGGIGPTVRSTLAPNETLTVRIYPIY